MEESRTIEDERQESSSKTETNPFLSELTMAIIAESPSLNALWSSSSLSKIKTKGKITKKAIKPWWEQSTEGSDEESDYEKEFARLEALTTLPPDLPMEGNPADICAAIAAFARKCKNSEPPAPAPAPTPTPTPTPTSTSTPTPPTKLKLKKKKIKKRKTQRKTKKKSKKIKSKKIKLKQKT